jgi:hypothetical protein
MSENSKSPSHQNQGPKLHKAIQPAMDANGNVFGEHDEKHEHAFPPGWLMSVVVLQYAVVQMPSGTHQPDQGSMVVKPYDVPVFNSLIKNNNEGFGGLHYKILHDPR